MMVPVFDYPDRLTFLQEGHDLFQSITIIISGIFFGQKNNLIESFYLLTHY